MKLRKCICILVVFLLCINIMSFNDFGEKKAYAMSELSVAEVEFYDSKDGSGELLPDLTGAKAISTKVNVINNSGDMKKVGVYLAYYDKTGSLLNVIYNISEINSGNNATLDVGMDIDEAACGSHARTFIWDETQNGHVPVVKDKALYATENIYVSTDGNDDWKGTYSQPLKTVDAAKKLVKTKNQNMTNDLFVYLREGTYYQDKTITFTTSDSGTNGKNVVYMPYNDESVTISGGKKISGFEIYDEEKNIWRTEINNIENIRELYVGGKKATRAQSGKRIYPKGFYKETVDGVEKILGYIVSSNDVGIYNNAENVQLHYTQIWKNTLCNVDEIRVGEEEGTNVIIMNPDAFKKTISASRYVPLRGDTSFYVENALELLDSTGEFYYDGKYLYYMADSSVDMNTAEVVVPVLDKLMEIKGDSLKEKVKNVSFDGITFAHSTRSDMDKGYLGDQAQSYDPIYDINSSYPVDNLFVGGNIRVSKAENISFTNNTFMGLSAVGLGLYDGANDIVIKGNCFYDLGDSAITAGLPTDAFMEEIIDSGVNVALYKPVTSNGVVSTNATYANDGDRTTIWSNPTNLSSDYLQIDLGKEYSVSEVRLKARLGLTNSATETYKSQTVHRRGFKVYASNDADFVDGGTVLATVSNSEGNEFDYDAGYVGKVTTNEKFRYIRFSTTVNKYFPLAEIEIISADEEAQNKEVCKNALISNNYITRIGDKNFGAPAISLYHTEGVNVLHNTIKEVPYSGICVGWGWLNKSGSETTKNNTINYNVIDGFAMRMYDAGGVYLNGPQINTQINHNYIKNQKNIYYALYSDSGSDNFTATNNVFEDVDYVFAFGREGNPSSQGGVNVRDNYSTSLKYNYAFSENSQSFVEDPVFYLKTKPSENVSTITNNAGIEDEYKNIIDKVPDYVKELTNEDIYGCVIDRHIGYYSDEITSLTDYNLVLYYLSNKIADAKKILEEGKDYTSFYKYYEFKNIISSIEKTRTNYYTATAPTEEEQEAGGSVHTTENLDRKEVINTRITLENAMEDYLASLN